MVCCDKIGYGVCLGMLGLLPWCVVGQLGMSVIIYNTASIGQILCEFVGAGSRFEPPPCGVGGGGGQNERPCFCRPRLVGILTQFSQE